MSPYRHRCVTDRDGAPPAATARRRDGDAAITAPADDGGSIRPRPPGGTMIREVSETLVDVIEQATPDLGTWVVMSSLSAADKDPTARRLAVALYAVEDPVSYTHLRAH